MSTPAPGGGGAPEAKVLCHLAVARHVLEAGWDPRDALPGEVAHARLHERLPPFLEVSLAACRQTPLVGSVQRGDLGSRIPPQAGGGHADPVGDRLHHSPRTLPSHVGFLLRHSRRPQRRGEVDERTLRDDATTGGRPHGLAALPRERCQSERLPGCSPLGAAQASVEATLPSERPG